LLAGELRDFPSILQDRGKPRRKPIWGEGVTVALAPQAALQMAINRNPDQLFRFAFPPKQR
jgi:hypothetical protein